jgi:site-specific DNA-adenine methylase
MALLEKIEDQAGVAIYCDPPYLVKKAEYVHDFRAEQHVRLAELLRRFRLARIVVSYYASPQLEQLYPGWTQLRYNMVKGLSVQGRRGAVAEKAQEVLLVNGPSAEEGGLLF